MRNWGQSELSQDKESLQNVNTGVALSGVARPNSRNFPGLVLHPIFNGQGGISGKVALVVRHKRRS